MHVAKEGSLIGSSGPAQRTLPKDGYEERMNEKALPLEVM